MLKIGIIGFGKVGSSLHDFLKDKKIKVNVYSKTKKIGNLKKVIEDSELIFICVKDEMIPEIVNKIYNLKFNNKKYFVHLSGATSLSVLDKLKNRGHETGKFHPLQTFPKRDKKFFEKIYATYSGSKRILRILRNIFKDKIKIIEMSDEEQILVHISCVFASNFPVYSLIKAEEILREINQPIKILESIIRTSFENAIKFGPSKALTGPARRGDIKTIKRHLKILKKFKKDIFLIYNYLSKNILKDERKI